MKIIIGLGSMIGGWIGWWLGMHVGIMTAFIVSVIGTGGGLFLTRRLLQDYR